MSSPELRKNRQQRRGESRARRRAQSSPPKPQRGLEDMVVKRLLLMAVDAAGGKIVISAESARRVLTLPMTLSCTEQDGVTTLELRGPEALESVGALE